LATEVYAVYELSSRRDQYKPAGQAACRRVLLGEVDRRLLALSNSEESKLQQKSQQFVRKLGQAYQKAWTQCRFAQSYKEAARKQHLQPWPTPFLSVAGRLARRSSLAFRNQISLTENCAGS
jgi:hypothetical protein